MNDLLESILTEIIVQTIEFAIKQVITVAFNIKNVVDDDLKFLKENASDKELELFTFCIPQIDMKVCY